MIRTSALTVALLAGPAAQAQGLVVQALHDTSSSVPDLDEPNLDLRFSSRLAAQAPTLVGDRAELDVRFSWSFGALTDVPPTPYQFERQLGWNLTLQVQDPLNRGFELHLDSQLRGVLGAGVDIAGMADVTLPALDIGVYEAFATTPRLLHDLGSQGVFTNAGSGLNRVLVDQSGRATVGRYQGTQSFLFYLEPSAGAALEARSFVPNIGSAYAWLQFGRGTSEPQMAFMNPGPGAPELDLLGQFLTFRVDYAPLPVPEPPSWALFVAGLLFAASLRRSRT